MSLCFCFGSNFVPGLIWRPRGTKQTRLLSPSQEHWRRLPTSYQKLENLLVLIWTLSWLWASREQGGRASETTFQFVFVFLGMSFCVCLCVFFLCFLSSCTNSSLIPRMGQTQSTPLGLVLNCFKDFHRVTEDSGLVVHPCELTILPGMNGPLWPEEGTLRLPIIYRVKV